MIPFDKLKMWFPALTVWAASGGTHWNVSYKNEWPIVSYEFSTQEWFENKEPIMAKLCYMTGNLVDDCKFKSLNFEANMNSDLTNNFSHQHFELKDRNYLNCIDIVDKRTGNIRASFSLSVYEYNSLYLDRLINRLEKEDEEEAQQIILSKIAKKHAQDMYHNVEGSAGYGSPTMWDEIWDAQKEKIFLMDQFTQFYKDNEFPTPYKNNSNYIPKKKDKLDYVYPEYDPDYLSPTYGKNPMEEWAKKSLKAKPVKEIKEISLMKVRLENKKGKSNKYYELELFSAGTSAFTLVFKWGRINSKGQDKVQSFTSRSMAEYELKQKRNKKIKEGYEQVFSTEDMKAAQPVAPKNAFAAKAIQAVLDDYNYDMPNPKPVQKNKKKVVKKKLNVVQLGQMGKRKLRTRKRKEK